MYGGRMGNAPDEGYKYRGRGYIQLTGKKNYEAAGHALGLDLVGNPDLASNPSVAMKIALQWWKDRPALVKAGRAGDVETATQIVNGGSIGLADRKQRFNTYLAQESSGAVQVAQATPTPTATPPASPPSTTPVKKNTPPKPAEAPPRAKAPAAPSPVKVAEAPPTPADSRFNSGSGSGPGYSELVVLPSGALAYY
jgi:putative chitinase